MLYRLSYTLVESFGTAIHPGDRKFSAQVHNRSENETKGTI